MKPLFLTFLLASPLTAQIESFEDSRAFVDEIVADTDFLIPLSELGTNIPFSNFRYPYIDRDKNVLFLANDWFKGASARNHNGIYYSRSSGELESFLKQEKQLPDGTTVGSLLGLRTDFKSYVVHRGDNRGKCLIAGTFNSPPEVVVDQNTLAPGRNKKFELFSYADVQDQWIAFNGTTGTGDYWYHGLYLHSTQDQSLIELIDNDGDLPRFGSRLGNFSRQPEMDEDWLVFAANRLDPQAKNCLPGRVILGWPMPKKIDSSFQAQEHFSLSHLEVLFRQDQLIPESGGARLHYANNPSVNDGIIAVVGGYDPEDHMSQDPDYRCLLIRNTDGEWINPIDTDTLMPGRESKGFITSINQWVGNQSGSLVFIAEGADDYQALYLYQVASETLFFIIDSDTPVVSKKVTSFEVSGHPLVGKSLSFMARFEDETSGLYLAALPGLKVTTERRPDKEGIERR